MKKRLAMFLALFGLSTAYGYFIKNRTPKTAPKSLRDHFGDVKETLGFDTARDMDTPSIIAERRADMGMPPLSI